MKSRNGTEEVGQRDTEITLGYTDDLAEVSCGSNTRAGDTTK